MTTEQFIAGCVENIHTGICSDIGWMSDSSPSKVYEGRFLCMYVRGDNLRIEIWTDKGRRLINWRMKSNIAERVYASFVTGV